jgi:hypothetical protein
MDLYWSLISFAKRDADYEGEPGLGGQLLYAGRLDEECRALLVAANIAGAATLAASDDPVAQKQAIRDGVVDFAVTNLDEALRILKNEVRKRETVAVCVGASTDAVEAEMRERGVAPDLIPARLGSRFAMLADVARRARRIEPVPVADSQATVAWSAAAAATQWLSRLDAFAAASLDSDAWVERRWVRLAPRFLGRMTKGVHMLRCEPNAAEKFIQRVELADMRCEIGVPVEIEMTRRGVSERHRFSPTGPARGIR